MEQKAAKKRILIVCQHFWPESFRINDIADYLANDKSLEVDILCGIPNYPSGKFTDGYSYIKNRKQDYNGAHIRRVFEIPRGNNSNFRIFLNYISFPIASLFHVPRLVRKKYDKVLIYQLSPVMMSIAGILTGKLSRAEITMYVLDLWPENLYSVLAIKNPVLRKLIASVSRWHYRQSDKLIVLSKSMRTHLAKVTGITASNITVIPQAAEKIYEQEKHDTDLNERFKDTFNLVFTGNISPAQSFHTIIEAAEILKNKNFSDIRWIIVGDGMSKRKVEDDVRRHNLSDIFIFEGQKPVTEIPKYTTIAHGLIGCLTRSSLLEATIPAKVMSYIASGKPLILAMDGEVQELINTTIKGGFAGPTGDVAALVKNIERLYSLPQEDRKSIEKNLKDYHLKHFERNLLLEKLYRFIFT